MGERESVEEVGEQIVFDVLAPRGPIDPWKASRSSLSLPSPFPALIRILGG